MNLMLSAVTHNDQRLTRPITAVFDAAGGTVGRADHCTLALPDPERFISRKQAEVVAVTGGMFLIRNVGSANPIVIGRRSLGLNESAVLQEGDVIRIAGYELEASYAAESPAPRPTVLQRSPPAEVASPLAVPVAPPPADAGTANPFGDLLGAAAPAPALLSASAPAVVPVNGNPFGDLLGAGPSALHTGAPSPAAAAAAAGNPFAGLLDGAPAGPGPSAPLDLLKASAPLPEPDIVPPAAGISLARAPAPASREGQLPDDFDPFALPPLKAGGVAPAADPFALVQPTRAPSIDQQFGLQSSTEGRDPLADFMRPPAADPFMGGAGGGLAPIDILSALAPAPATAQAAAGVSERLAPIHDAFEAPRPMSVDAAPAPLPPQRPLQASDAADVTALWQAFCRGAEIQVAAPGDEAHLAQRLEHVGRILRAAVAGTQELMAVRASTKYEMRAQVTQIQARSNNPLKFAPDVRTGVEQLVEPAARGFLEGPAAMEDAMKDLIGHMIGSVAGMRAALEGLLDRFTPEMLEQTLGQGSMLDSLLPASRKAKLWELYLLRYQTLRESAQDDFHAVFGKAFLAAYEQQVERLKKRGGQG